MLGELAETTGDDHRRRQDEKRGDRTLARFQASTRGLRRVFEKHFPDKTEDVEAAVFHLAKAEAQLPKLREAIRLARYPGAGNRGPRKMAMGLWENVSFMQKHLKGAMEALESLSYDPEISGPVDVDTTGTDG
jgi:hypothetical protein